MIEIKYIKDITLFSDWLSSLSSEMDVLGKVCYVDLNRMTYNWNRKSHIEKFLWEGNSLRLSILKYKKRNFNASFRDDQELKKKKQRETCIHKTKSRINETK